MPLLFFKCFSFFKSRNSIRTIRFASVSWFESHAPRHLRTKFCVIFHQTIATAKTWKATKEYLNHKITGVPKSEFSECAFGPISSHPFPSFPPPLFPLQAMFTLAPLLPSPPPPLFPPFLTPGKLRFSLAHQNRTIAIASDFRVDGAKSQKSRRKKGFGLRNRSPKSQIASDFPSHSQIAMQHCFLLCRKSRDFWGLRWASQSQIAKIAAISVR